MSDEVRSVEDIEDLDWYSREEDTEDIEDLEDLEETWRGIIQNHKDTSLSPDSCDRIESKFISDLSGVRMWRTGGVDSGVEFERRVNYLESEVVSTLEDCKTKYQEKRRRDRVDLARCLSKVVEKLLNLRRR